MAKKWTKQEDNLLIEVYCGSTKSQILAAIDKPWMAIRRRAVRLSLKRDQSLINEDKKIRERRKDAWTEEEENLLKEIFENNHKDHILLKIARPWSGIKAKAKSMGMVRNKDIVAKEQIEGGKKSLETIDVWTQEEDDKLTELYENTPREHLLQELDRTWSAIRSRAQILKLKRNPDLVHKENYLYTQKALMEKYGVDHPSKLPDYGDKCKITNNLRRGVDYPTQSKEVRDKITRSVQKRYSVDNVFQSKEIKDKIKQTKLIKHANKSSTPKNKVITKSKKSINKVDKLTCSTMIPSEDIYAEDKRLSYLIKIYEKMSQCRVCKDMKQLTCSKNIEAINTHSDVVIISQALASSQAILSGVSFFNEYGKLGSTGKNLEKFLNMFNRTVYPPKTILLKNGYYIDKHKDHLSSVYSTEIVNCYPGKDRYKRNDRVPDKKEIEACIGKSFLIQEINVIKPKLILLMGNLSYKTFFKYYISKKDTLPLTKFIEQPYLSYLNMHDMTIPVIPIQHASGINLNFHTMLNNSKIINIIKSILNQ